MLTTPSLYSVWNSYMQNNDPIGLNHLLLVSAALYASRRMNYNPMNFSLNPGVLISNRFNGIIGRQSINFDSFSHRFNTNCGWTPRNNDFCCIYGNNFNYFRSAPAWASNGELDGFWNDNPLVPTNVFKPK